MTQLSLIVGLFLLCKSHNEWVFFLYV
jgi:hypothetical protein